MVLNKKKIKDFVICDSQQQHVVTCSRSCKIYRRNADSNFTDQAEQDKKKLGINSLHSDKYFFNLPIKQSQEFLFEGWLTILICFHLPYSWEVEHPLKGLGGGGGVGVPTYFSCCVSLFVHTFTESMLLLSTRHFCLARQCVCEG